MTAVLWLLVVLLLQTLAVVIVTGTVWFRNELLAVLKSSLAQLETPN